MKRLALVLPVLVTRLLFPALPAFAESTLAAAKALLAKMSPDRKFMALLPFDSPARTKWHFFPKEREGIPIERMDEEQKELLWKLLETCLSPAGIEQAKGVIRLEQVLLDKEQSPTRDPGRYYLVFWGEPAPDKRWGFRFEGHHLSLNVTLEGEKPISMTPLFLGANPAKVLEGEWMGFRNLPLEEDVAYEFLAALGKEDREKARVPGDPIEVEGAEQAAIRSPLGAGLRIADLDPSRRELFKKLLETYLDCFQGEAFASLGRDLDSILAEPELVFQWRGGMERGQNCYYRICGKGIDIQFSNRQNNANHVHTLVWLPGLDFGLSREGSK
ncbi:MAG: DUF3500 domain-containing protein [Candidatus Omnitrophica bacterium]|nr:DUF3500 domain-containing protein [Candidatus Omnitrophota bacterium]